MKLIKKSVFLLLLMSIVLLFFIYNKKIKEPPVIETIARVDIYNSTDRPISDMKIICNKEIETDMYTINIPVIQAKERIIIAFSTALQGNYDTAVYVEYNDCSSAIATLEKGYFGLYSSLSIDENHGFKYFAPWIPSWSNIYYFDNIGNMVMFETRQEYRDRIGYKNDYNMRINLVADESLKNNDIKKMKEYYERFNKC